MKYFVSIVTICSLLVLSFAVSAEGPPAGWTAQSSSSLSSDRTDMLYLGVYDITIDGESQPFYQWQFNATNQKYIWITVTDSSWADIPVNYAQDFSVFVSSSGLISSYNAVTSLPKIYFSDGTDLVSFTASLVTDFTLPSGVWRYDFHIVNGSQSRYTFDHLQLDGSFASFSSNPLSYRVSDLQTETYIPVVKDSGSFLSAALGWVGDIGDFILDNPALIVLVVAVVAGGFGVGLLRRIKNS